MKAYDVEHVDDLGVEPKEEVEHKHVDVQLVNLDDHEVLVVLVLPEVDERKTEDKKPDVALDGDVPVALAIVNFDAKQMVKILLEMI